MGYTKLFSEILDSTIWREPLHVKVVWITMLAMCDRDGEVRASVPGLADRARVDRSQCEQALAILMAPDPDSRTTDHEGRRIAKVDGGWRLINHAAYKRRMSPEERRERDAERKRIERAARRVTPVTSADVRGQSTMSGNVQEVSHADQIRSDADQTRSDPKRETLSARPMDAIERSNLKDRIASQMIREYGAEYRKRRGTDWLPSPHLGYLRDVAGALADGPDPDGTASRLIAAVYADARREKAGWPWRFVAADLGELLARPGAAEPDRFPEPLTQEQILAKYGAQT